MMSWAGLGTKLWVLSLSDDHHTLLDISERSGLIFELIDVTSKILTEKGVLKENTV